MPIMTLSQKDISDLPDNTPLNEASQKISARNVFAKDFYHQKGKNSGGSGGYGVSSGSGMKNMKMVAASLFALSVMGLTVNASASNNASDQDAFMPTYEMVVAKEEAVSGNYAGSDSAVNASAKKGPNKWFIGGAMALILGALFKLVGANRMMNIVANAGPVLRRTVDATKETIVNAPKMAAKAAASAMASPIKMLLMVGGLAIIGFTGISVFDLHWGAGIVASVGMSALTWVGMSKFMRKLRPQPIRANQPKCDPSRRDQFCDQTYNQSHAQKPYSRSSHYDDRY